MMVAPLDPELDPVPSSLEVPLVSFLVSPDDDGGFEEEEEETAMTSGDHIPKSTTCEVEYSRVELSYD